MTSKNLFFHLLLENTKRNLWVYALAFLGFLFFLPVYVLIVLQQGLDRVNNIDYTMEYVIRGVNGAIGTHNAFLVLLTIVGAVICAVSRYFYLTSKKQTDFYHSIPVKRETLFFSHYVSGLLNYMIPYVLMLLVTLLIIISKEVCTKEVVLAAISGFGCHLLGFLIIYTSAILALLLTGNLLVSLLAMGVFASYGAGLVYVVQGYLGIFLDTFYHDPSFDDIRYTSPLVAYFTIVMGTTTVLYWVGLFLVTVGLLVAAIFLYRIRPFEAAGKAMAFPKTEGLIKVALVIFISLGSGWFFYSVAGSSAMAWMIFGILMGLLLSHATIDPVEEGDYTSSVAALYDMAGFKKAFYPALQKEDSVYGGVTYESVADTRIFLNTDGNL